MTGVPALSVPTSSTLCYLLKYGLTVSNLDASQPSKSEHAACWKQADILDYGLIELEILEFDPDIIVHFAAVTDPNRKATEYSIANTCGTQNIINIAKKLTNLKKIFHVFNICLQAWLHSKQVRRLQSTYSLWRK